MMPKTIVPRLVRKATELENSQASLPESIENYREQPAWVVLGEPGMGKSELLKSEADKTNGIYLTVVDFIHSDIDELWRNKTIFLDGLDEVRGSGSAEESVIQKIRRQLRKLDSPSFRIACRAADWYGSTDSSDLQAVSTDNKIVVLLLEPLTHDDVITILSNNYTIEDPKAFVEESAQRGIADLIDNPQVLGLLAEAVEKDHWPDTRDETYEFACQKLAKEHRKKHRDKNRTEYFSPEQLLEAAGQLCAVLLLSDKRGIALDDESVNEQFPNITDYIPPQYDAAIEAVRSKLFRPDSEERFVPSHRSIAEYLASRWLAKQVSVKHLPLRRVLNLLLGNDSRSVAGLRGLYGWLALHSHEARTQLIENDVSTVILYGDVKPMSIPIKRLILSTLHGEATQFIGSLWDEQKNHRLHHLIDDGLNEDFIRAITTNDRDDKSQSFASCVLEVLSAHKASSDFLPYLFQIISDDTWWGRNRREALEIWLNAIENSHDVMSLLEGITTGTINDHDDELLGILLHYLYPKYLGPDQLLRYLHLPKTPEMSGSYNYFWNHFIPEQSPPENFPVLLDGLVGRSEFISPDPFVRDLNRMVDRLLVRGIEIHGEDVTDDRLFNWLGIGVDEHGHSERENHAQSAIGTWLMAHPDRYKGLLSLCYKLCEKNERAHYCVYVMKDRLPIPQPPEDIGLWHFEQISHTDDDAIAELHLTEAIRTLFYGHGSHGLTLEMIEDWCAINPHRKFWVDEWLKCDLQDAWQTRSAANKREYETKREAIKRENTITLAKFLPEVAAGIAPAQVMRTLAGIWANRFIDTPGDTPEERFSSHCENWREVFEAAKTGFQLCLEREDLPTIENIIDLSIKQREHLIRLPCLIGMDLRWQADSISLTHLSENILRRMIAFQITEGLGTPPNWFMSMTLQRPELVAEILITYATTSLKSGQSYINYVYLLDSAPEFRAVAAVAAPKILEKFPIRANSGQISYLEHLLKAALRYVPKDLENIASKKITIKSMDVAQKVYWLACSVLLNASKNESALWTYIGKSQARVNHLSKFFSERLNGVEDFRFTSKTIGKLIELITPYAEIDWGTGGGIVTETMHQGDLVRALIGRLGTFPTPEAGKEIDRLLGLPTLKKAKYLLEKARDDHRVKQRESNFFFASTLEVAKILANHSPVSVADLTALVLDHLDDIATDIRRSNDDIFRAFWNVVDKQPISQREENLCRDILLTKLRERLYPFSIDCQPEGDYVNDKRADIRISFGAKMELPIEIKRDSNAMLWRAIDGQLIQKYAIAPLARNYGIYLVLWFGGANMPNATDGGKKPRSPEDLQQRLEAKIDPINKQRIFVRVIDVTWPT